MEKQAPVKLDYEAQPPKPTAIRLCAGAVLGALAGIGVSFIVCELIWGFVTSSHQLTLPLIDTLRKIDIGVVLVTLPCGVVFGLWWVRR